MNEINETTDAWTNSVKTRARQYGITLQRLFIAADISPSAWAGWRHRGVAPTLRSIRKVEAALSLAKRDYLEAVHGSNR